MALTQGAWSEKTVNGMYRTTCNVAFTASENDAYTLKTPKGLDVTRKWTLFVAASAAADGATLPFDLWIGNAEDFVISGNDSNVTAVNGAMWKVITNDILLAVTTVEHVFLMDPYQATADVVTLAAIATGYKLKIPIVPYYAFNLDGGGALNVQNIDFTIVQVAKQFDSRVLIKR